MIVRAWGSWVRGASFFAVGLAAACSSSAPGGAESSGSLAGESGALASASGATVSASGSLASASGSVASSGSIGATGLSEASGDTEGGSSGAQMVGTGGGTVMQDGVTLAVPAGAVSTDTPITVAPTSTPSGYTAASQAFSFGPAGTVFATPITVTLPLSSATPGAHLFWSNAAGGFDDVGGTVNGLTISGQVSHFSVGFAAVPLASADGGASSGSTTQGQADATTEDATTGSSGSGESDAAVAREATAASGSAEEDGSARSPTDASTGAGDATELADAASLCAPIGLNAISQVTQGPDGESAPAGDTYTGGTIASTAYYLTHIVEYSGTYSGPRRVEYIFDATAQTMRIIEDPGNGTTVYLGLQYTIANGNEIDGTVVCNTSDAQASTMSWYYTAAGGSLTFSAMGSTEVLTATGG